MQIISKEKFVEVIERVKEVWDYHSNLNTFFANNNAEGYLFQPDCMATVIDLLHLMFGAADEDEWISYFCFELDFGREWVPGMIKDAQNKEIKLQTAEDLYDFLIEEKINVTGP